MGLNQSDLFVKAAFVALVIVSLGCEKWQASISSDSDAENIATIKQNRYMSTRDLMDHLDQVLPIEPESLSASCREPAEDDRVSSDEGSTASGSIVLDQPGSKFVQWYAHCLKERISLLRVMDAHAYYGDALTQLIESDSSLVESAFSDLPREIRVQAVREQVERLIGSDEWIDEFGFFDSNLALAKSLLEQTESKPTSVQDAVASLLFLIGVRTEFLSE